MIRDDAKKLVRGLKDISPLFVAPPEEFLVKRAPELQVLGVSSPEGDGDSLFLNSFFASQIASEEKTCSLVSVLSRHLRTSQNARAKDSESFGSHLQRHCLYWDELKDLVNRSPVPGEGRMIRDRDIFLDFEHSQLLQFDQALGLIDKWVLLLKPTAESLTEGYKMIKAGLAMNSQVNFFITLEGRVDASKGELIFERFSEFVFKHLKATPGWLGWMDLADPEQHFSSALHVESLQYQPWNARPDLGKFALANWIESLERKEQPVVFAEVL